MGYRIIASRVFASDPQECGHLSFRFNVLYKPKKRGQPSAGWALSQGGLDFREIANPKH